VELGRGLAEQGTAVMIATHDVEFAATFADRVILLARGEIAADGTAAELLSGGWYFSSEVARILDGTAITVEEGVAALGEVMSNPDASPAHARGGAQ
jgi:energy-coupling factor transport system ATP-binding protein